MVIADATMGSDRSFGIVFAVVFTLIGLWPLMHGETVTLWSLYIAGAFFGVAIIFPRLLRPLNKIWFRFGLLLGMVMTPVIMALLFFLVLLPTGILLRCFGKDTLKLKKDSHAQSYWIPRQDNETTSMKNQF